MLRSEAAGRTDRARGHCLGGSIPQCQREQHQAHSQERLHRYPCRIKFMLAHFSCCQFSKVGPKRARLLWKFGALPEAGSSTTGARWLTQTWGERPRKPDPSQLCLATLAHRSGQIFTWPLRRSYTKHLATGEVLGLPLAHPKHGPTHKHPELLLLREASSPGAGDAVGMMLRE